MTDLTRVTIPCCEEEIEISDGCDYLAVTANGADSVTIKLTEQEYNNFFYFRDETTIYTRAELVLCHIQFMLRDGVDRKEIDNYCADERSVLEGKS